MSSLFARFPLRRFARDAIFATVFNVLCALLVTFVLGNPERFLHNLLVSMCVGTIAFLVIDGGRLSLWGDGARPNWPPFFLLVLVAVPTAQYGGTALANWIIGAGVPSPAHMASRQMTGMLLFTLFATGAATLFYVNRDRIAKAETLAAQETARAEAIARQALQAQLQLLQAQIEPHMLFNTLANLQGLIGLDPARAQHMLDQLIVYLRATLSSSRADTTTLGQEFDLMDAYLGLMQVRMGERLSFSLTIPSELRGALVPPMLLQPLVENAITHGLEPKVEGGHIDVSASAHDGVLTLSISDNGLGLAAKAGRSGTKLGLFNTRERLLALHGEAATLTLADASPCGAVALLTLPLQTP